MNISSQSIQANRLFRILLKSTSFSKFMLQQKLSVNKQTLNKLLQIIEPKFKSIGLKLIGFNPIHRKANVNNKKKSIKIDLSAQLIESEEEIICDIEEAEKLFVTRWYDLKSTKRKKISIQIKQKSHNSEQKENNFQNNSLNTNDNEFKLTSTKNQSSTSQSVKSYNLQFSLPKEYIIVFTIIFLEAGLIQLDKLMFHLKKIQIEDNFLDTIYNENDFTIKDENSHSLENIKTYDNQLSNSFNDLLIHKMKKEGYLNLYKDEDNQIMTIFDWRYYLECPNFEPTLAIEEFCSID